MILSLVLLQIRARDQESKWLTAMELLDDDTYTAADNSANLVSRIPCLQSKLLRHHNRSLVYCTPAQASCYNGPAWLSSCVQLMVRGT